MIGDTRQAGLTSPSLCEVGKFFFACRLRFGVSDFTSRIAKRNGRQISPLAAEAKRSRIETANPIASVCVLPVPGWIRLQHDWKNDARE